MNQDIARFHRTVGHGSLQELQQVLQNGVDVNAPGHGGRTALMVAISVKDLQKMQLLIEEGADPELADEMNTTALRHAVFEDFADGVRLLLSLGVDRGYHPKYPLRKINYDFGMPDVTLPKELSNVISEEEWQESIEATRASMLESAQNPTVQPVISDVASVEVVQLLLDAGDDLNLAPNDVKRAYMGMSTGGMFRSTPEDYWRHRSPCYGAANPERMDYPFWSDMVRLGGSSYSARVQFDDTQPCGGSGVVWCYDRFGSSITQLEDGRFVQIAGEHEDYYDPDFYIYNDVVIHDGQGNFQIFGYPRDVFPPTDFHTATLVGDWIYIIGCLGYMDQREVGRTPVYRLRLESWKIEAVNASGDSPSWIHDHRATYDASKHVIHVEGGKLQVVGEDGGLSATSNDTRFELDLSSFQWRMVPS